MIIGGKRFEDSGRTYVMGILNVTPDSFSDGGKYNRIEDAVRHAERMLSEGADIIDVGAESTRPGFELVGDDEELKRLVPVIENIKKRFDVPVSVDTFHSRVAKEALCCGADMINDVWGLKYAGNEIPMAEVVKNSGAAVCVMHNSEHTYACGLNPESIRMESGHDKSGDGKMLDSEAADVKTLIRQIHDDIYLDLKESIDIAKRAGIKRDKIMIDPGVGFAKDYGMNMSMIANIDMFRSMGFPVLLGTSRKSVIGLTLDVPVNERLEGTLATTACAVLGGCSFVRVHDVGSNVKFIKMFESLLKFNVADERIDK